MTPSKEMLNAWFDEHFKGQDDVMYWAGIAAFAHLSSPGSEEWRRKHGFENEEDKA